MIPKKLDLVAIESECGKFYLCFRKVLTDRRYSTARLDGYLINGLVPKPTFSKYWVCTETRPERITVMVRRPDINHRYELLDKSLVSEKLPEFIDRDDVAVYDDDYEWEWIDEMRKYRSLYKLICDNQPDEEKEVMFDMEIALVASVVDPVKMHYRVELENRRTSHIVEGDVIYQIADKVIFPDILLPQRPCKLSSKQSYMIVRQYIKDHIDPAQAQITSDYDFCFTVKRRIKLAKVKVFSVDVNSSIFQKRKRKPKYVEKRKTEKEVVCFQMTYSPKNYEGYTPIKGFTANTQGELKEKIDAYCESVIHFINKSLAECEACDGYGVILPKDREVR